MTYKSDVVIMLWYLKALNQFIDTRNEKFNGLNQSQWSQMVQRNHTKIQAFRGVKS